MARKSKRRPNWAPILWLLVAINVVCGFAFSPITSATKVKVIGAMPSDQVRIEKAAKLLADRPALRSPQNAVLVELYRRADMRSAVISQSIFGRAKIEIKYDEPVAILVGNRNLKLTESGLVAAIPEMPEGLPQVRLFPGAIEPSASFSARWEQKRVVQVCQRVANSNLEGTTVLVATSGNVRLQLKSGAMVRLGHPEYLAAKFEALARAMEMRPDVFKPGIEINLVVPDKPAFGKAEEIE